MRITLLVDRVDTLVSRIVSKPSPASSLGSRRTDTRPAAHGAWEFLVDRFCLWEF